MEKINVGDWVYIQRWDIYREVVIIKDNRFYYVHNGGIDCDSIEEGEKVEELWKIMLLELGRETLDFKPGDVIVTHQDVYVAGYHDHDDMVLLFEENLVTRFCPEEHSIEV